MSRPNVKRRREEKEMKEKGYIPCGYCNELVKPSALKCTHCGKWYASGKQALVVSLVLIISLSLVSVYYIFPTDGQGAYVPPSNVPTVLSASPTGMSVSTGSKISVTFNRDMDQNTVQSAFTISPYVPGTFSWNGKTMTYTPNNPLSAGAYYTVTVGNTALDSTGQRLDCGIYSWRFTTAGGSAPTLRSIGTGDNDFWSASVNHPSWVLTDLQVRPVLILTHTEGCYPCQIMTETCRDISAAYSGLITYHKLISGTNEPQATDTFKAYDPVPPNYVPLTTVLTKGPNNSVIWHSWEGVVDEATLSSWLDDAITYHNQNR